MDLSGYSDDQLKAMLDAPPAVVAPAQAASAAPAAAPDLSHLSDDQLQAMLPAGDAKPLTVHGTPIDHGATASGMAGFLDAIPFAGSYLVDGAEKAGAALATLRDGGTYADNLAKVQQNLNATRAAHPYAGAAGGLAGGVVGTAPMVAALPGAFGLGAGSLGLRALTGGLTGAAIGGGDAAVRADGNGAQKLMQVATGAGAGFGGGVAGPLIGAGAGKLAQRFLGQAVNEAEGVPAAARQYLVDKLQADDPAAVMANMKALGDQAMMADYGPGLRGIAQGLATKPGPGQQAVMAPLTIRNAGTNARIGAVVDQSLGPAQSPLAYSDALKAERNSLHGQLPSIYAAAPEVDVSPVVETIGQKLNNAVGQQESVLKSAQNWISDPKAATPAVEAVAPQRVPITDPATGRVIRYQMVPGTPAVEAEPAVRQPIMDPATLANAKTELDGLIKYGNPTLGVTPGGVSKAQGAAADVRGGINEVLRNQVPGYADIMDQSSGLARRIEAVDNGTGALGNGPSALRPDDFAKLFAKMSPDEQAAYRVGMRGVVDAALGTKANDLVALKGVTQGDNGWNAQKLAQAYNQDAINRLNGSVDAESRFRNTYNKVVENSESARNLAAAKGLADAAADPFQIGSTRDLTTAGMVASAGKVPINALLRALAKPVDNTARDLGLAKAITAQGDERNRILAQVLRAHAAEAANTQLGANQARAVGTVAATVAPSILAQALRSGRR
jgi:hypothetical protein